MKRLLLLLPLLFSLFHAVPRASATCVEWEYMFDFTVDDGGWTDTLASYSSGNGWSTVDRLDTVSSPDIMRRIVYTSYSIPATTITEISFIYNLTKGNWNLLTSSIAVLINKGLSGSITTLQSTSYASSSNGTNKTYSWTGSTLADEIYLYVRPSADNSSPYSVSGSALITSVTIKGTGTNPFTGDNCVTPSDTPTPTLTFTPSDTPTNMPTPTPTFTPSDTPTYTPTFTPTPSETYALLTPNVTPTMTDTLSPTPTRTPTNTLTPSNTPTGVVIPTDTPTRTPTYTPTATFTPSLTWTPVPPTQTRIPLPTYTPLPSGEPFDAMMAFNAPLPDGEPTPGDQRYSPAVWCANEWSEFFDAVPDAPGLEALSNRNFYPRVCNFSVGMVQFWLTITTNYYFYIQFMYSMAYLAIIILGLRVLLRRVQSMRN